MTQSEDILVALKQGRYLTPIDALRDFGCMRLGARIWDLRRTGVPIQKRLVGVGKKYAEYYLEEGDR